MPNWCSNSITIKGPVAKIETLWKTLDTDNADRVNGLLEALVPIGTWEYGTAVDTWGTKWDVNTDDLDYSSYEDGTASISGCFDSAWAPPTAAFQTYSELNPDVYAELWYEEPGMCFVGHWNSDDGDDSYEYTDADATTISEVVPAYLVDAFDLVSRFEDEDYEDDDENYIDNTVAVNALFNPVTE